MKIITRCTYVDTATNLSGWAFNYWLSQQYGFEPLYWIGTPFKNNTPDVDLSITRRLLRGELNYGPEHEHPVRSFGLVDIERPEWHLDTPEKRDRWRVLLDIICSLRPDLNVLPYWIFPHPWTSTTESVRRAIDRECAEFLRAILSHCTSICLAPSLYVDGPIEENLSYMQTQLGKAKTLYHGLPIYAFLFPWSLTQYKLMGKESGLPGGVSDPAYVWTQEKINRILLPVDQFAAQLKMVSDCGCDGVVIWGEGNMPWDVNFPWFKELLKWSK